jgi:hypothetical protein
MRLGRLTRALLIGTLVSFAALFAIVVFGAPWTAAAFGSAALILLAAGGWTAVGSALDFIGMRLRVPIFIGLLLFAAVCSFWNDNHAVRTLAQDQPAHRSNLRASLEAWMARHEAKIKAGERVPFYVVNAEGGGIRAAYWTATVLGEIHRRSPQFSEHLFSVSGVSGGSLGASVFVALLAQSREDPTLDVKQAAQNILGEDFLSPVVASILYPDLVQRFLPFSVSRFDRGASLEQAWERAWAKYVPQRNRMMEPLDRLWENPKEWTPALFLNGTWVETGKRIVTSNLRVAATKDAEDFVDIEDAQAFFAPHALSLSSAAHMSARFTYVSPAGSLRRDGKIHGRVVDGGYFENSGATTTLEILQNIDFFFQTDKRWKEVDIYVIHISNEPVEAKYALDSLVTAPDNPHIKPHKGLNEVMSPLHALLKARDARGFYARESLMWRVGGEGYFFHFGLCQRNASVPLGWVLSQSARHQVDTELTQPKCIAAGAKNPVFNNPASFDTIEARLTPPSALSPAQRQ